MRTKPQSSQRKISGAAKLIMLAVIFLFSCSQKVLAQQWSTNANGTDISNANSGNVGVGTTSPGVKLDILSSVNLIARFGSTAGAHSQVLIDAPAGYNSNLTLQRGGVSKWYMGNRASNDRLSFIESTGAIETLTLMQNGNVGIGTTAPNYNLHIVGAAATIAAKNPGTTAGDFTRLSFGNDLGDNKVTLFLGSSNWAFEGGANSFNIYQSLNAPIGFFTNNLERLRVLGNGNVGIGTNAPTTKLDVAGQIRSSTGGFKFPDGTVQMTAATGGSGGAVDSVFGRTGVVVAGNNDYTWAQINKSTSSLADIQTRSAGDLNAGTVPIARLGVSGIPDATTFLRGDNTWATVAGGSSQWTTTSGTNNISYNSGNVGIGTTTPGTQLHIVRPVIGQAVTVDTYGAAPDIRFRRAEGTVANPSAVTSNKAIGAITAVGYGTNGFSPFRGLISFNASENWTDSAQGTFIAFHNTATGGIATSEKMRIDPSGNVGIGTTNPGYKLDVAGQIRSSTGFIFPDGSEQTTAAGGAQSIFKNIANGSGTTQFSAGSTNDSLRFEGTGGTSVTFDNATKKVIINSSTSSGGPGSVSWAQVDKSGSSLADITTRNAGDLNAGTVPLARLGGGIPDASKFLRGDNTWQPVPGGPSQWTSGTNNISYTSGNVGIGTPSPGFLLDVHGGTNNPFRVRDSSDREYFSTSTRGTTPVVNIAGRLTVDSTSPDGGNDTLVRRPVNNLIFAASEHPDPNLAGAFLVRQKDGSFILTVDQRTNGNVGIGTTNPTAKLDVNGNTNINGNINVTGNINAKYQDVAEWVESSQNLVAGTVVVLDHTRSNQVIASSQAYDTRVAGVVSAQPGIALGEPSDDKVLVATTGRVRLTVDASKGPIHIGDLLVTSDIPGVAMKSEAINVGGVQIHRPGTLVGKALEPLAKGQGKILVLLSLQ